MHTYKMWTRKRNLRQDKTKPEDNQNNTTGTTENTASNPNNVGSSNDNSTRATDAPEASENNAVVSAANTGNEIIVSSDNPAAPDDQRPSDFIELTIIEIDIGPPAPAPSAASADLRHGPTLDPTSTAAVTDTSQQTPSPGARSSASQLSGYSSPAESQLSPFSSPALEKIQHYHLTQTEGEMTLDVFLEATDELIEMMTRKKMKEMEQLTGLILSIRSMLSERFEKVDKRTLVARLVTVKDHFETDEDSFYALKEALMMIASDE